MLRMFCISAICLMGALLGEESPSWHLQDGWDSEYLAQKYFHHSELQSQWAWHMLSTYHFIGNERVLDFGCGDGKITTEVAYFVPNGTVFGVDISSSMISFARRCFPKLYHPNLSFGLTSELDTSSYDLIYSFCVFHLIANPIDKLSYLSERLAPNGKLLLVVPSGNNPTFFAAARDMFQKYHLPIPWDKPNVEQKKVTMRTEEGVKHCLSAAGLQSVSIDHLHTPTIFFNKKAIVEWMIGTVTANWQIPLDKARSFFSDLVDRMVELDESFIDSSGAYHLKLSRIEVVAKKADA